MNHPSRRTAGSIAALASTVLWGLVELIALTRSRWSMRWRPERDMRSHGDRG